MTISEEFDSPFDTPVQDYSRFSRTGLAQIALYHLSRCGVEQLVQIDEAEASPNDDSFRLTSWVDPDDALFGNALAISRPYLRDDNFMSAYLYKVNRDTREILPEYPKSIDVPRRIEGIRDLRGDEARSWAAELAMFFDRDDLEHSLNMMTKSASVFYSKRPPCIDKYVYFALAESEADELGRRFPGRVEDLIPQLTSRPHEKQHITEWTEFMNAASEVVMKNADPDRRISHVNIHCEIGDQTYYIKLAAENGELFGAQILCEQGGKWQSQLFEIDPDRDEDGADLNMVNGMWDRAAILASLRHGEVIGSVTYDYYRSQAEKSLTAAYQSSPTNSYLSLEN